MARILWMSDSPTLHTGFGLVTRELLSRLGAHHEVASLGWGYDGWPYDQGVMPWPIYPSSVQSLGQDSVERALGEFSPDLLVGFGDPWMLEWLHRIPRENRFRFLLYFPLDGFPLHPAWANTIAEADVAVACSEFARSVVREALPERPLRVILHGVDTKVFHPLDREKVRARNGLVDRFVVGCVARNQPRKNYPILIEVFAKFAEDRPDAFLYLHADPDDIGWDLRDLLNRCGISDRTGMSRKAKPTAGVSGPELNEIYNLFDVMALPTAGEGFGLPLLEAMSAGVPVVTTRCSACVELVEGRGELIAVKDYLTVGRYNIKQALPDADDLVMRLEQLYSDPGLRRQHARVGREFAVELDWAVIAGQWLQLIDETL